MNAEHMSLEIDCKQRKFAVTGTAQFVQEWFERLWPEFSGQATVDDSGTDEGSGGLVDPPQRTGGTQGGLPETFGEFYHLFPTDLSDQDKVLVAAYFVQRTSEDNSFSTGAASELLRGQGVRPANPSQSIRRLRDARRLFPVANGAFRVSETGVRHLDELRDRAVQS